MMRSDIFLFSIFFCIYNVLISQEIQIFKVEDFDLKGKVKSCLVSTNYGKEEYNFNENGFLTQSITRYNDSDYDITSYVYSNGMLIEKRLENYRNNTFDESTSIASFYTIDSLLNLKVTEKIVSYNKEFLDQYEYFYKSDSIFKIIHTNREGIDETQVSYDKKEGAYIKTYTMNDVIQKSVHTSMEIENDSLIERKLVTKKFIEGEPNTALEEVFNADNTLTLKREFFYNTETLQYVPVKTIEYSYDEMGVLANTVSINNSSKDTKSYLYQFDENGNWIKEIITPDNMYKTRKISYYEVVGAVNEE